ncbi:methyltransferase domain-containing protein [Heliobacterium gestii]|uniref:Methyltransferase domain-containing protein n=1 Tax=Heliomicrobium gestii TaxID=2699 RepID=A0A845LCH6_HELGE|nr:class I SAM-dependent methyltransferase [Heliomicrobium gestii]MBM7868318.1 2-polyprenyl-3-methyl-5-hydroxy-6-metoxy-1,4-benzoquinol methylase [Heliomicrobium gestii]MZP44527.1 methyltransferase domain-containing protein [Heliomicrobium gestii]
MKYDPKTMQNYSSAHEGFTEHYNATPPWDIGKPQAPYLTVIDQVKSPVLDAGCGTGSTALFFAARGLEVTGIDFVESAIQRARIKAAEQSVSVNFLVKDAMTLNDWNERFASVIDSGLLHIYSKEDQRQDRTRYVQGLAHVLKPGGRLFLLSFTDEAPEGGVSEQELYEIFAKGWEIESVQQVIGEINQEFLAKHPGAFQEAGPKMWFAVIRRTN